MTDYKDHGVWGIETIRDDSYDSVPPPLPPFKHGSWQWPIPKEMEDWMAQETRAAYYAGLAKALRTVEICLVVEDGKTSARFSVGDDDIHLWREITKEDFGVHGFGDDISESVYDKDFTVTIKLKAPDNHVCGAAI